MRRRRFATGHWAHPRDFSPHPSPHKTKKIRPSRSIFSVLVSRVGLEPTTPSLRGSCSNQLSYRPSPFTYYTKVLAFLQEFDHVKMKSNHGLGNNKMDSICDSAHIRINGADRGTVCAVKGGRIKVGVYETI